jgi:hypothetical protein
MGERPTSTWEISTTRTLRTGGIPWTASMYDAQRPSIRVTDEPDCPYQIADFGRVAPMRNTTFTLADRHDGWPC